MLGEIRLRIAGRRARGRVTVPLLVDGDEVLMDSVAIARHAEREGQGAPLFPAGCDDEITAWNERSEEVMTAGRAMLLPRLGQSAGALREQLPPFVPRALRPMLKPLASSGVSYLARKYGVRFEDGPAHESRARASLDTLRSALADGRERLVGEALSFADITMATALQFILPVADHSMPLGPATREAWTHQALASEYADLLVWRDQLYAEARHP